MHCRPEISRSNRLEVTVQFGTFAMPLAQIDAWERKRLYVVTRQLGLQISPSSTDVWRTNLRDAKLDMGTEAIELRLGRKLAISEMVTRATAKLSRGRWKTSAIEIASNRGTAVQFLEWFLNASYSKDSAEMIEACPDHFVLRASAGATLEVVETTGGSLLPLRFFIDYDEASPLIARDPSYPLELSGTARMADGLVVGGVRHQFVDTPQGFSASLSVAFPALTPPYMVRQHRWHLACEFSNWIHAANQTLAGKGAP